MKVEYQYESLHKDEGVTKFYKVDDFDVIRKTNEVRIIVSPIDKEIDILEIAQAIFEYERKNTK